MNVVLRNSKEEWRNIYRRIVFGYVEDSYAQIQYNKSATGIAGSSFLDKRWIDDYETRAHYS